MTITCISTGAPTPSITWVLNGRPVTLRSTEYITEGQSTLVRSDPNDPNSHFVPNILLSTIISYLLVENAQYPDHDGVYTCTGSNDNLMINSSSAMINVQVIGMSNIYSDSALGRGGGVHCCILYVWRIHSLTYVD